MGGWGGVVGWASCHGRYGCRFRARGPTRTHLYFDEVEGLVAVFEEPEVIHADVHRLDRVPKASERPLEPSEHLFFSCRPLFLWLDRPQRKAHLCESIELLHLPVLDTPRAFQ